MYSYEQKYSIGTNDGNYKMSWDISSLINDLSNVKLPILYYNVQDLCKLNYFFGSSEHAMKTDVESPCIIAKLNEKTEKLIDGNHRLFKAAQLNLYSIPCFVLPEEYHKKFIIDYDHHIYEIITADLISNS